MKKNILILVIAIVLGAGCVASNRMQSLKSEAFKIEICSAFNLPAGVQQHCDFNNKPWKCQKFKWMRVDLNDDGIEEILLERSAVKDMDTLLEPHRTWVVLQKAFNGEYICIGTIGTPVQITKRENCTWKTIICYGPKRDDKMSAFSLFVHANGQYREWFSMKSETLSMDRGIAELEKQFAQKTLNISDEHLRVVQAGGYLLESHNFLEVMLQQMSVEQRKEFLKLAVPRVKQFHSNFMRVMYAKTVAMALMSLNDFQQAREIYEIALTSQLKDAPTEQVEYAEILGNYAIVLAKLGYAKEAERRFKEALQIYRVAITQEPNRKCDLAFCLTNLAVFYNEQKNYAQGEKVLLEAIQIFEALSAECFDEEYVSNSANAYGTLADIYNHTGRNPEEYYGKALDVLAKIEEPNSLESLKKYAVVTGNASEYYGSTGNIRKALSMQQETFKAWNQLAAYNQDVLSQLFTAGYKLACLMRDSGDVDNALSIFEEILKYRLQLAQANGGKCISEYMETVVAMVEACIKVQKYKQAQQLVESAEKLDLKVGEKNMKQFRIAQAAVYRCLRQYKKSADILETILKNCASREEYAAACYNLGRTYLAAGQVAKAEKVLVDGIAKMKKTALDIGVVRCLNQLAQVHCSMQNAQLAEADYLESMSIYEKLSGTEAVVNIHDYAVAVNNLASLYRQLGRNTDSYALYTKTMPVIRDSLALNDTDKAKILRNFGNTCVDLNKFDEAEKHYRIVLNIYEVASENNAKYKLDVAEVHFNLGNLFRKAKQYDQAEKEYLTSGKLYHELGEQMEQASIFMLESRAWNNLANMFDELKQNEKAEKYFSDTIKLRKQYAQDSDDKAKLAQIMFNLAWHYVQTDAYEKATALFAEGLQYVRALNKEDPGKHELLLAQFLIFNILGMENNTELNKLFEEIERLLNKYPEAPEAKQLRVLYNNFKNAKIQQGKSGK